MQYYILKNRKMPWGDYGNILFEGLLNVMDKNYNITEIHSIERVAPYIPEIYKTHFGFLVIREDIYKILKDNGITGIEKLHKAEFKKLVEIDWQSWDLEAPNPKIKPRGGEPINYINGRKHNEKLLENIKHQYFSLELKEENFKRIFETISDKPDYENYTDVLLISEKVKYDIFIGGAIVVSEKFKNVIEKYTDNCLRFIPLNQV
ncbi:hypothetical protein ACILE2_07155 [Capnocytophaga canimorsus]|uniref:hypothetical protein n=1 Tax=Capnocytophaga canimorsus TaxID=28188 RepID=UPI0037D71CDF